MECLAKTTNLLLLLSVVTCITSQPTIVNNRGWLDLQSQYIQLGEGKCAYTFLLPASEEPTCTGASTRDYQVLADRVTSLENSGGSSGGTTNQALEDRLTHLENMLGLSSPRISDYPFDCQDAYLLNGSSLTEGIYLIQPESYPEPFPVYCEVTDDGVWTVIQRRQDGSVNFNKNWDGYKYGFGYLAGEHWLGNEKIHHMLNSTFQYKLRFDLEDWEGNTTFAEYSFIQFGNEEYNYALSLGLYTDGNAGDSFQIHNGVQFSTYDRDNDGWSNNCCACSGGSYGSYGRGGWWYFFDDPILCHTVNINGLYIDGGTYTNGYYGIGWYDWRGHNYSLKKTVMKVKRVYN